MASTSTSQSLDISVEIVPAKINKDRVSDTVLSNTSLVTIPHLPNNPLKLTYKSAVRLSDKRGVHPSRIVPHIGARSVTSKAELTRQVKNFADLGVRRLLLVGGNPEYPEGPYLNADHVLKRVREIGNFDKLLCGVYPESESASGVQLYKYASGMYDSGISQLCLSPSRLKPYKADTRIGVPSRADWNGLYTYMRRCGVGPSIRYPIRNMVGVIRFMTLNGFDTARFVRAVQPHTDFHVYDFGRLEETVEELIDLSV